MGGRTGWLKSRILPEPLGSLGLRLPCGSFVLLHPCDISFTSDRLLAFSPNCCVVVFGDSTHHAGPRGRGAGPDNLWHRQKPSPHPAVAASSPAATGSSIKSS